MVCWKIMDFYYNVDRDNAEIDGVKTDGNWLTLRLAYIGEDGVLSNGEDVQFMKAFAMPKTVTEAMLNNGLTANTFYASDFEIDFTAYAIQAQEVNGVDAAYAAYFEQN